MPKEMTAGALAERSLITKYRKTIWNRFIGGCKDYELIKPGDRIAVCISGGKDSMLSPIHNSEPTRRTPISYAGFCLKKKN